MLLKMDLVMNVMNLSQIFHDDSCPYMDFMLTLEDVGLNPQESVFVQAR